MDTELPPEADEARRLVRRWIAENVPAEWLVRPAEDCDDAAGDHRAAWRALLDSAGWVGAGWPTEYGGLGLSPVSAAAAWDELYRLPLSTLPESLGEVLVGPTLLAWGSPDQKRRYLPGIIDGTDRWCQGFSEPDCGSDLAAVRTRATRTDDGWRLNGAKSWTSGADRADYMFLLARSNVDEPRHKGLSFFLMPMHQPGVEVRPIERMDGTAEFAQVFLDDARCCDGDLVGEVHDGWRVATTTLGHERGTSSTTNYWRFRREIEQVMDAARGRHVDAAMRRELATAWSTVEILRANYLRILHAQAAGHDDSGTTLLGSATKLIWSEYHQRLTELQLNLLGPDGLLVDTGLSVAQVGYLFARSETIWGGTSQIQRNIVGERVLGLGR